MTITLPESMRGELEARAKAGGFDSVDDYVAFLVRESDQIDTDPPTPQELGFSSQEELEAKLIAALDSGPPVRVTPEFWDEIRKQVADLTAAQGRQP